MSGNITPAIKTTATTLQGQLLEIAIALKDFQKTQGNSINSVSIDPDIVIGRISITAEFPAVVSFDGDEICIKATDTV